ncbi:MAG: hypothetical protein J6V66_03890 [Clostridia bacterium]|nr:hypothetical protein [Clostridia bacterium]
MPNNNNLHEGHRKRLREKFKQGKEVFQEHELLELLLGYSISRKDTNPLAHELINHFDGLKNVLSADSETLQSFKGISENTATLISLVGYISTLNGKPKPKPKKLINIEAVKSLGIELFKGLDHEVFYMFYLDENKNVLGSTMLDSNISDKVELDFEKFSKAILLHKPKSAVIMHNHFAKYPHPSEADDLATAKICAFLNYHKVTLFDHVIISGEESYSYFYDNRLQNIKTIIKDKIL